MCSRTTRRSRRSANRCRIPRCFAGSRRAWGSTSRASATPTRTSAAPRLPPRKRPCGASNGTRSRKPAGKSSGCLSASPHSPRAGSRRLRANASSTASGWRSRASTRCRSTTRRSRRRAPTRSSRASTRSPSSRRPRGISSTRRLPTWRGSGSSSVSRISTCIAATRSAEASATAIWCASSTTAAAIRCGRASTASRVPAWWSRPRCGGKNIRATAATPTTSLRNALPTSAAARPSTTAWSKYRKSLDRRRIAGRGRIAVRPAAGRHRFGRAQQHCALQPHARADAGLFARRARREAVRCPGGRRRARRRSRAAPQGRFPALVPAVKPRGAELHARGVRRRDGGNQEAASGRRCGRSVLLGVGCGDRPDALEPQSGSAARARWRHRADVERIRPDGPPRRSRSLPRHRTGGGGTRRALRHRVPHRYGRRAPCLVRRARRRYAGAARRRRVRGGHLRGERRGRLPDRRRQGPARACGRVSRRRPDACPGGEHRHFALPDRRWRRRCAAAQRRRRDVPRQAAGPQPVPVLRPVSSPAKSVAGLARFLVPYRARIAAAALALVVAAGCVLALGQGVKHVVDNGFGSGDARLLDHALAAMVAVAAVLAVATWFRFYLMMSTGERVITDLRRAVFDHILGLEPAFFEATRTGEVISRLTNDTMQLQQVIGYGLSMFVRNLLMITGAAVMLFVTSWKLALLVLLGVPATLVPILLLGRRVRRLSRSSQDRVADVSVYVDEAVHEIRTVQAYAHEDADRRSFAHHAEAAYRAGVARIRQKAWLISSVMLIAFCAVAIILWIGGRRASRGGAPGGGLAGVVFYASGVAGGGGGGGRGGGGVARGARGAPGGRGGV